MSRFSSGVDGFEGEIKKKKEEEEKKEETVEIRKKERKKKENEVLEKERVGEIILKIYI